MKSNESLFANKLGAVLVLGLLSLMVRANDGDAATTNEQRTNFIDRFDVEDLAEFVKTRKFVMVMANTYKSDKLKPKMVFIDAAKEFERKEVFFLIIDVSEATPEQLREHDFMVTPALRLYIYGIPKHFTLQLTTSNLSEWLTQILLANYNVINSLEDIHHYDKHYAVYASKDWVASNQAHFKVLAKLIAPLSIYTGLSEEQLAQITQSSDPKQPIFAFREADNKVFVVERDLTLKQKADFIIENEFAEYMVCHEKISKLIFDYRIPVLAYLGDGDMGAKEWSAIRAAHHHYKEYLLLVYVNVSSKDKSCLRLMDFLNTYKANSLRILNLSKEIKRYAFADDFDEASIASFLTNYIQGSLKKYTLNERLRRGSELDGLAKANFKLLKETAKALKNNALFYIHASPESIPANDLDVLKMLKDVTRSNKTFKLYMLNHDKNDVDGRYHSDLPFIFLVSRLGEIHYYEQPVSIEDLLGFLLQHVPYLKIEEPQWDENL